MDPEADNSRGRSVYLVTLPQPKQAQNTGGRLLVAPGSMSMQEILEKFIDCCAMPIYQDARGMAEARSVTLAQTGVNYLGRCTSQATRALHRLKITCTCQ